ncbi:hypothetical protein SAMN05421770_101161 [Granulicella rosea]|uniref:Uncharacterized protein n=1 Tax=Granulicella rosea TaxID=474952 RepID=A0A239CWC3_9BACT|nr:DUF6717 family protein [Granulicella rosea]SNS24556.1 hypothetical protein SAMN05421770_101161 [Granulicella rosea]
MNQINVIAPYKYLGIWVFDDPKKGLVQEAFVGGADTILDLLTQSIPHAEKGFVLLFSSHVFPGFQHHLTWRREEKGGNVYCVSDLKLEGWLCPALLRYFGHAPAELFIQLKSLPAEHKHAPETY